MADLILFTKYAIELTTIGLGNNGPRTYLCLL